MSEATGGEQQLVTDGRARSPGQEFHFHGSHGRFAFLHLLLLTLLACVVDFRKLYYNYLLSLIPVTWMKEIIICGRPLGTISWPRDNKHVAMRWFISNGIKCLLLKTSPCLTGSDFRM